MPLERDRQRALVTDCLSLAVLRAAVVRTALKTIDGRRLGIGGATD